MKVVILWTTKHLAKHGVWLCGVVLPNGTRRVVRSDYLETLKKQVEK